MAVTGSRNFILTVFVSTRRKASSINRTSTLSARSVAPRARPRASVSSILVAENEEQETKLVRPRKEGGDDLDGVWNDDWHHSAIVALTGRNEAYYTDYKARRRNSFPRRNMDICTKGSRITGRRRYAARRPSGIPPGGICFFPRKSRPGFESRSRASAFALAHRPADIAP